MLLPDSTHERLVLHLPETLNDGRLIPNERLQNYEDELLDIAGGFMFVCAIGAWRSPVGHCYREPIRLYEVDAPDRRARERLLTLARRISVELTQEAVYVTSSPVRSQLVVAAGASSGRLAFAASSSQSNGKERDVHY
jgi:hypothetical protein